MLNPWGIDAAYRQAVKGIDLSGFPIKATVELVGSQIAITFHELSDRETGRPRDFVFKRKLVEVDGVVAAVEYIYWSVQEFLLHELAECFKFNSSRIYDPHKCEELGMIMAKSSQWVDAPIHTLE
jgi:hypothetical protein